VIRTVAAISLVYDLSAGLALLLLRAPIATLVPTFAALVGPAPLLGDLLGIFLTSVGMGYLLPYREPDVYRSYMWIFGVALKTAGAAAFLLDYVIRHASPLMLLFAASDGAVAVLSLAALVSGPGGSRDKSESRRR
jgi:hypothetical protein